MFNNVFEDFYDDDDDQDAENGLAANLRTNNEFVGQYVNKNINYTETGDGRLGTATGTLSTENNNIPGFGFTFSMMDEFIFTYDYFRAQYQNNRGHTNYVGSEQGGAFGSVQQEDPAQILDNNIRLGTGFVVGENGMIVPYGQFGWFEWIRSVNDGETYDNNYIGGGVMLQYAITDALVVKVDEFLGSTQGANINVTNAFAGPLGSSLINKISVSADYTVIEKVHANFSYEYTTFKYGESDIYQVSANVFDPDTNTPVVTNTSAWEPNSSTVLKTITAGLSYTF
jgi:hypothetical protein